MSQTVLLENSPNLWVPVQLTRKLIHSLVLELMSYTELLENLTKTNYLVTK